MKIILVNSLRYPKLMRHCICLVATFFPFAASAVSPESILQGQALFEETWSPKNPSIGNDGLGPLFNAESCVACHHQGGIGGGGDSRFNAKTIAIQSIRITGAPVNDKVIANLVSGFHPGFIGPKGDVVNNMPLAHHGGTNEFQSRRNVMMSQFPVAFSKEGGPVNPAEVRIANDNPIVYRGGNDRNQISINARLYQRNTTSLFGIGLIDQVSSKAIRAEEKKQRKHPEISGRPSTLDDGRLGRFGWRGNVSTLLEFVDQASANEVGLQTKRKRQPIDPTLPRYRNPRRDLADAQVVAMAEFVAALPAPVQDIQRVGAENLSLVQRGQAVFDSVGCAVCHPATMGPAKGIYSDLLLHDMGPALMDLNHAGSFIRGVSKSSQISSESESTIDSRTNSTGYYGGQEMISTTKQTTFDLSGPTASNFSVAERRSSRLPSAFSFYAPSQTSERIRIAGVDYDTWTTNSKKTNQFTSSTKFIGGMQFRETTQEIDTTTKFTRKTSTQLHIEPTNWNQEWRTPPLWGVADSAPYMHDGRAETLLESISMHGGEAAGTRDRYLQLSYADREAVLMFLKTLVAPSNVPQANLN